MTRQELRVALAEWFCGCGAPDEACARLLDVLRLCPLHSNREAFERLVPGDGWQMLLLYSMTNYDLIEHGGSVGGSWLTDKGREVRDALEREAGDGFDALTNDCCCHGYAIESELLECPECGLMNRKPEPTSRTGV